MEQTNDFQDLMGALWQRMDVAFPPGQSREVYTITFDNQVAVHFISTQSGRIDVIAEAGVLDNKQAAQALLDLMELNHPPYTVNVDQETGAVLVWTRQELAILDCMQLVEIVTNLLARVRQAKLCIEYRQGQSVLSPFPTHHLVHAVKEGQKNTETGLRN